VTRLQRARATANCPASTGTHIGCALASQSFPELDHLKWQADAAWRSARQEAHDEAASLLLDGYPVRARRKKSRWCTGLLLNCSLPKGHRGNCKPRRRARLKGRKAR